MKRLTKRSECGHAYYPECFNEECAGLGCESLDDCKFINTVCERLASYEDAEEQGRLHIAPIADGTTIFRVLEYNEPFDEPARVAVDSYLYGFTETVYGEKDKDWFLFRKEAEDALQKIGCMRLASRINHLVAYRLGE